VLLIPTDPANSLAIILPKKIADRLTNIKSPRPDHFDAWQSDSERPIADSLRAYETMLGSNRSRLDLCRQGIEHLLDTMLPE
jgi:hypothetical protein